MAKAAKPAANKAWDPAWARFAGRYKGGDDGVVQVVLLNQQLVLLAGDAVAAETKTILEPIGDGRFRLTAPTGGAPIGEIVRFEAVPGRPLRLYRGDNWSERTEDF